MRPRGPFNSSCWDSQAEYRFVDSKDSADTVSGNYRI